MTGLFLMSPPGLDWRLAGRANFRSKDAGEVDARRARREWLALAEAIEARGGTVVVLPSSPGMTGLPYAAECGHPVGERFLLPRMQSPHRAREKELWAPLVGRLGF
jgi:N-dimethylarginine dimethylaminohydrolase